MTPRTAEGPAADRTHETATNVNQASEMLHRGTDRLLCSAHGSSGWRLCSCRRYRDSGPVRDSAHLRQLDKRIGWLRRHEHWWARELRWHRERFGPDCECKSCTGEGTWAA